MASLLSQVAHYRELGFKTVALNGKVPVNGTAWREHGSAESDFEKANGIGLFGTGYVILDIDVKNGAKGLETLATIGPLPETAEVQTPSGGKHLYFRLPEGLGLSNAKPVHWSGIDIRSASGYVAAPPSPGYTWIRSLDHIAPCPFSVLEALLACQSKAGKTTAHGPQSPMPVACPPAKKRLEHHLTTIRNAEPGARHQTALEEGAKAFRLRSVLPEDEITGALEVAFMEALGPDREAEARRTLSYIQNNAIDPLSVGVFYRLEKDCFDRFGHHAPPTQRVMNAITSGQALPGGRPISEEINGTLARYVNAGILTEANYRAFFNGKASPDKLTEALEIALPHPLSETNKRYQVPGLLLLVKRRNPSQAERDHHTVWVGEEDNKVRLVFKLVEDLPTMHAVLDNHPSLAKLGLNTRTGRVDSRGAWSSETSFRTGFSVFMANLGHKPSRDDLATAEELASLKSTFDPALDRLEYCKDLWVKEGQPDLLSTYAQTYFGAEDSDYGREIAKVIMMGLCHRIARPGCGLDTVPVLVSADRGIGKSKFFEIIGRVFADVCPVSSVIVGGTRFDEKLEHKVSQAIVVILDELACFKSNSIEEIKAFLSRSDDVLRVPYAPQPRTYKRGCVFIATTNQPRFAREYDRRWLVLPCAGERDGFAKRYDKAVEIAPALLGNAWAVYQFEVQAGLRPWQTDSEEADLRRREAVTDNFREAIQDTLDGTPQDFINLTDLAKRAGLARSWLASQLDTDPGQFEGWEYRKRHRIAGRSGPQVTGLFKTKGN